MPWKCDSCGWSNFKDSWTKCENCGAKRPPLPTEDDLRDLRLQERESLNKRLADFRLTTTPELQGFEIRQYYGIVNSMVVLGTGLFAEIGADFADFFGTRSYAFQRKLDDATKYFVDEITIKALKINPEVNAIVGLKMDYTIGEKNILLLCGTGTAVKIEKL